MTSLKCLIGVKKERNESNGKRKPANPHGKGVVQHYASKHYCRAHIKSAHSSLGTSSSGARRLPSASNVHPIPRFSSVVGGVVSGTWIASKVKSNCPDLTLLYAAAMVGSATYVEIDSCAFARAMRCKCTSEGLRRQLAARMSLRC
jgi:hypothetical protein